MDFVQARFNMVEQQVRPWDVLDPRVLEVIGRLPREQFVPEESRQLAYADTSIPLGMYENHVCRMLNPMLEGRILQSLQLSEEDIVLEIGTGSGYLTACLASLARHVDSVDINPDMTAMAEKNLAGIGNVILGSGDAAAEWHQKPAYDAIVISGSMPQVPDFYKKALKTDGRLFVVTGDAPVMKASLVTREDRNQWLIEELFETSLDRLIHAEKPAPFVF